MTTGSWHSSAQNTFPLIVLISGFIIPVLFPKDTLSTVDMEHVHLLITLPALCYNFLSFCGVIQM